MPCKICTTMMSSLCCGKYAYTANRATWPRMPTIMVVRQPSRLSVAPRMNIVSISAIWPTLITGMIQLPGIPTPPAVVAVPRKLPVQLKKQLCTNEPTSVTSHNTSTKGCFNNFKASSHANFSAPLPDLFGGVCGKIKLKPASASDAMPATPLEEATTPSLEALKVYSLGLKTWAAKGDTAALPFYKRAVDLDPNFAMAYAQLSVLYHDLNEAAGAAENGRKAYDLREKVSERERFWIESGYYDLVTEELEKGAQADELWLQTYPRDAMPYTELGFVSATLGNWEKALEEWQVAVRLDPKNGLLYYLLSLAYMSQNRLDEAEAVFKQAEEHKLDNEQLLQSRYWLAFLKANTPRMAQLVSGAMGKPGAEDLLLAAQADTEGWHGKLKNAHDLTRRAMDSAQHNDAQ